MKKLVLLSACCMVALSIYAQRTTDEQPYGLREDFRARTQEAVVLPAPDMVRIEREDRENDLRLCTPRSACQIPVKFTVESSGGRFDAVSALMSVSRNASQKMVRSAIHM